MIGECEMTGKKDVPLFKVKIEGTIMHVSKDCIKYGELIREPKTTNYRTRDRIEAPEEVIVENAGQLIKAEREKRKLTQAELAKILSIKESVLHNIESGHLHPRIDTAKKIQQKLHVKLIEQVKKVEVQTTNQKSEPLTMEQKILAALQKAKEK